ncbi:hypothetical protein [Microbacterium sp. 10M-3C3]|jgi:hypothetical protein|uniref:hypothetical protein n=1 Tax=Microbacterium sp. 10M-3C3 TaxID=2483401 RepID=UPI000F631BBE|nr:hypothetical protein [Microbacterium sp. 10M-3C3]
MRRVEERPAGASGLTAMLDLLSGPLEPTSTTTPLPLLDGTIDTLRPTRAPAIFVRVRRGLAREAVVVRAAVGAVDLRPTVFTAWTEGGSLLPLYVPTPDPAAPGFGRIRVTVRAWRVSDRDAASDPAVAIARATGAPLSAVAASDLLEGVLVDGDLARLAYLLSFEGQRTMTMLREIAVSRHVGLARMAGLDAIGADHGVPRLDGEDDETYRSRLRIFTQWALATPSGLAAALNGAPESAADPGRNAGLPSTAGIRSRFRIVDATPELAVAARIVQVGGAAGEWRARFAGLAAGGLLFDLDADPSARLPRAVRARRIELRKRLDEAVARAEPHDDRRYLSILAAVSLDRAVRLLSALTGSGELTLLSAMTVTADPRLDLGLGFTLKPLTAARIDRAIARARDLQDDPGGGADLDPEVRAAIAAAPVRDRASDPMGAWLFESAGLHVARLSGGELHLTPLSAEGLVIEGPGESPAAADVRFDAKLRGAQTGGRHILVDEAWTAAGERFQAAGAAVPDPVSPAQLRTTLTALGARPPVPLDPAVAPLAGIGLAPAAPEEFAARVASEYDLDLLLLYRFDPGLVGLAPDSAEARDRRDAVVDRLADLTAAGFHSVRLLPDPQGSGMLVLAAVSSLPGGSNRPGQPAPAMYRWAVIDLTEDPEPVELGATAPNVTVTRGIGGQLSFRTRRPGILLVVCVAYVRRGGADPYEVRIELPGDEVLDVEQYGYLMNLLEQLCPLGVEINTFDIRRDHVSVDGAAPGLLSGRVSRSYTRYRRRRPLTRDARDDVADLS